MTISHYYSSYNTNSINIEHYKDDQEEEKKPWFSP